MLRRWWISKHETAAPLVPFEDRTLGGLLREFYADTAAELSRLRAKLRADGHDPETEVRISDLERVFSDSPDLQSLDAEESLENWTIPRRTGDPLADRWEEQIARGEVPDLDAAM